ncbi:MAG: ATP-dependent DNA helicase RecG [Chloroflexi bacterium]|nr:ATP-dependent DNA helicase RecG [Chloroflexota bacterium]
MDTAREKLGKILQLEADQGHRDRAVIGGLERFLAIWQEDAQQVMPAPQIDAVMAYLQGYSTRSPEERTAAVTQVLNLLAQEEWTEAGKPEAPPSPITDTKPSTLDPAQPQEGKRESARPPKSNLQERRNKRNSPPKPAELPLEALHSSVNNITGVSDAYARRMARLGVRTVRDLLYLIPRRYDDFSNLLTISQLMYGQEVTIVGRVDRCENRSAKSGRVVTEAVVSDMTGSIRVTWFNQPFIVERMRPTRLVVLSGKVDQYMGRLVLNSPEWEPFQKELIHTGRLVPVYPLTEGLPARWLRTIIKRVVDGYAYRMPDPLPEEVRDRWHLPPLSQAIRHIHFPESQEKLAQAKRRLAFDEFLIIQIGVLQQRRVWRSQPGRPLQVTQQEVDAFKQTLPFEFTGAQDRSLHAILEDIQQPHPMSRLLQGDVGSGKTAVAAGAMWIAVQNGAQAAMMAPTEILAEQHFQNLTRLFKQTEPVAAGANHEDTSYENASHQDASPEPGVVLPRVVLLSGKLNAQERKTARALVETGEAHIAVGTHALIQEGVDFKDLALVVVDEQHRFGVEQRKALRTKGFNPHMLVMSATPIPRTLALTLYGDLDVSVIDELPPGRQPIQTRWLAPRERERAYAFIRRQISEGHQAFIICPLVETSDKIAARAATEEYERLRQDVFPDLKLGLLHGRMKPAEKDAVMQAFYSGDLHILVSTAVVEVGIDVPNATVMLVEGAERFGLSQLHQFRGRVGRGQASSYCLLLSDSVDPEEQPAEERHRLQIIAETQDGFKLAEEDLKLRGPGEFFGTRQSGLPDLKVAQLSDIRILEDARQAAQYVFERDPDLASPGFSPLAEQVREFWQERPTVDG